jgi:uncharacterized protein (DUF433 family)
VYNVSILDRRVLGAREAARLLRMPASTLLHWLEGDTRPDGTFYPPVLREEPNGRSDVTWGEIVEARYLRAYRDQRVSMQQLRPVMAALRQEFGVPYPLAHFKPFIGPGRRLLLAVQEQARLPEGLRMVYEAKSGQLILDRRVDEFLERVEFAESGEREALRLYPAGRRSRIVMDPRLASAAPTVNGVRTEVLAEQVEAGAAVDEVAQDFGLPEQSVKAALSYEWSSAA